MDKMSETGARESLLRIAAEDPGLFDQCLNAFFRDRESSRDPAMAKVASAFVRSEMTLSQLAAKMGYDGETARQSAWQFLNKTKDPRLSMLRRFAKAVDIPVQDLL